MNLRHLFAITLIVLIAPLTLAAEREPVKIGATLYLTGEWAPYGNAFKEGNRGRAQIW